MFASSWIAKYFDVKVKTEHNTVYFVDKKSNPIETFRFLIYIFVPDSVKQYFFPLSIWKSFLPEGEPTKPLLIENISRFSNGFRTLGFQSSRSMFYSEPYFFFIKSPTNIDCNSLRFNNFVSPNIQESILCMLTFNDEIDAFSPVFTPTITLPYQDIFSLPQTLEFTFCDENKSEVKCQDNSQLFVSLKIL